VRDGSILVDKMLWDPLGPLNKIIYSDLRMIFCERHRIQTKLNRHSSKF